MKTKTSHKVRIYLNTLKEVEQLNQKIEQASFKKIENCIILANRADYIWALYKNPKTKKFVRRKDLLIKKCTSKFEEQTNKMFFYKVCGSSEDDIMNYNWKSCVRVMRSWRRNLKEEFKQEKMVFGIGYQVYPCGAGYLSSSFTLPSLSAWKYRKQEPIETMYQRHPTIKKVIRVKWQHLKRFFTKGEFYSIRSAWLKIKKYFTKSELSCMKLYFLQSRFYPKCVSYYYFLTTLAY